MSHGAFLRQHSSDPELASHIMHDYTTADLDPQTRGMLDFTAKLTRDPTSMQRDDVETLRGLGLSDEQVLSTVLIASLFNFMTRLADGLGVEFPARNQEMIEGWLSGPATTQKWMLKQKA
jgi:uncharacterized peroxidase-related enzyme